MNWKELLIPFRYGCSSFFLLHTIPQWLLLLLLLLLLLSLLVVVAAAEESLYQPSHRPLPLPPLLLLLPMSPPDRSHHGPAITSHHRTWFVR